ncbi:uncharacterized protein LOC107304062 isoform X1 [Oryza brachyantha]|uniref:uncharacterized protein LOC107304062 isoform X1 n=1 Tax=Oryza brachyantha TaxID=4533 RepID=UPI00077658B8|nr:uncharacterized protein LOC107304062 isoform X1 [Oryza brachyantha]
MGGLAVQESAAPSVELEGTARPPPLLMLKEWMELESSAELSRDGFGWCYPRQLAAELRGGSGRRRNGAVIERVSAAVRAALFPPPSAREGGESALSKTFSRRLKRGFWKKRKGEGEEGSSRVESCAAAAVSGRDDGSSPAMSPRRRSWEGGHAGGVGARLGHQETQKQIVRMECETTCRLDEELEEGQRLSPVSVMDFLSQDDEDDGEVEEGNSNSDYDDGDGDIASPTFQQSLANIRRVSQQLLQKIRQFEQLAELDASDLDDATTAKEDVLCEAADSDSVDDDIEEAFVQDLLDLLEASSPGSTRSFQKLLVDFFYDGLPPRKGERLDGPDRARLLLETAKAWLDGQDFSARLDRKAEVEEIERLGRWRCFKEDEQGLVTVDLEDEIFSSLIAELVRELG